MKIGLVDVDGHNFPNLALMKIAAYHKKRGDIVEWVNFFERYDKVYISKVFTFTPDVVTVIQSDNIERGGMTAYGFITRGCIRNCPWCIVPKKEGAIHKYRDIEDVLQNKKAAVLMDNNILASDCCQEQLEKIAKIGCKVDFNQGLDARIIVSNPKVAVWLSKIKWLAPIRLACDSKAMMPIIKEAADLLRGAGCKPHRLFSYVLLTDLEDSLERINFLREMDIMPFAQPYRDFTPNQIIPQWQKDLAHWTNRRELLTSCDFKDFQPRHGFYCSEYFNN